MRETWYVLEDGNVVDPADVAPDGAGVLRNQDGVAVAMRGQVPWSRGVDDPDAERDKAAAQRRAEDERAAAEKAAVDKAAAEKAARDAAKSAKDVKPEESKSGYKTRETKAD
jgi:hypothetical protein